MAREKENYREMLLFLNVNKKIPLLMSRGQACEVMGISRDYLSMLISKGKIKLSENKIPIGSVANYLCE